MPEVIAPVAAAARVGSHRARWRFRLSVRGLMILVVLIGAPLGWVARRAAIQRRAVARVQALGGQVLYEDQTDPAGTFGRAHQPWGPAWLRRVVGDEPFQEVTGVVFTPFNGSFLVDDESIDVLNNFPRLRRLSIAGDGTLLDGAPLLKPITAAGLARLTGVPDLRELSLYRVEVDVALVRVLPRWPDLEEVAIMGGTRRSLDGAALATLGGLPKLKRVQMYTLDAPSAEDLRPVLQLGSLERLMLAHSPRDDAGVDRLGSIASIREVALPRTEFTAETLAALAHARFIHQLSFDGSKLGSGSLRALTGLSHLQYLEINLGDRSGERNAHHLIHRVPARFGDADLDALHGLPLTNLKIMGLDATDAGVARLLAGRSFYRLGLSGRGITDASIPLLARQTRLTELYLADTGITDAGLVQLAASPALRILSLVDNRAVTDVGMASLKAYTKLEHLTFRQPGTRPATIQAIRAGRRMFNIFEPPAEAP